MALKNSDEVTAVVVLKPQGATPAEPPSTRNLAQWTPPAGAAEAALEAFRAAGFNTHGASGSNFQISGTVADFERFFGVRLCEHKGGTVQCEREGGTQASDLPLDKLPKQLKRLVHAIGFSEPPDFGPGNFSR